MKRQLVALMVLPFISACGDQGPVTNVAGSYHFERSSEVQEISVESSGHYVNSYFRDGSLVWRDEGKWQRDEVGGEQGITFSKFRFGLPDQSARPGYWFVVPERALFGNVRLCFDPDLGCCFERN